MTIVEIDVRTYSAKRKRSSGSTSNHWSSAERRPVFEATGPARRGRANLL